MNSETKQNISAKLQSLAKELTALLPSEVFSTENNPINEYKDFPDSWVDDFGIYLAEERLMRGITLSKERRNQNATDNHNSH